MRGSEFFSRGRADDGVAREYVDRGDGARNPRQMSPRNEVEDWLTELPPLDGDDDEPDGGEGLGDDIPEGDGDASLDDAAADDLEVDEGIEITEEESLGGD